METFHKACVPEVTRTLMAKENRGEVGWIRQEKEQGHLNHFPKSVSAQRNYSDLAIYPKITDSIISFGVFST